MNCIIREITKFNCLRQFTRGKFYNPKWRKERAKKVIKVDYPDFDKVRKNSQLSPEEFSALLKKEGHLPPRHFQERPLLIASTNSIFEPYVPPEGDGIASTLSKKGAMQRITELEMKGKSYNQLRKIKPYEEKFNTKEFAEFALETYKETFKLLENIKENDDKLHELLTEKAYPEMIYKLDKKTFRWEFLESLEPPRVVHVRTLEVLSKENVYAQITVRFHSKLMVAIYDRFGRLFYGSEKIPSDFLEYVVFEKHLSNQYGAWRVHGKVVPEWSTKSDDFTHAVLRTMLKPKTEAVEEKKDQAATTSPPASDGEPSSPNVSAAV